MKSIENQASDLRSCNLTNLARTSGLFDSRPPLPSNPVLNIRAPGIHEIHTNLSKSYKIDEIHRKPVLANEREARFLFLKSTRPIGANRSEWEPIGANRRQQEQEEPLGANRRQ